MAECAPMRKSGHEVVKHGQESLLDLYTKLHAGWKRRACTQSLSRLTCCKLVRPGISSLLSGGAIHEEYSYDA